MTTPETKPAVVLFDGMCNFCSSSVNFIIDRDPRGRFQFAALQSEAGRALLASHGRTVDERALDTLIVVDGGRLFDRSTAALRIARQLRGAWRLFAVFFLVPRPLRDVVYSFIARRRYRWFGTRDACRVPTPELRARFLT